MTWACPACGLVRALGVWREAVGLELPVLTCAMVPGLPDAVRYEEAPGVRALLHSMVRERARAVAEGKPTGGGCGLLVCTWADGRRVWAAEAEGLEDLLAEVGQ
jgi:hypothetical protein